MFSGCDLAFLSLRLELNSKSSNKDLFRTQLNIYDIFGINSSLFLRKNSIIDISHGSLYDSVLNYGWNLKRIVFDTFQMSCYTWNKSYTSSSIGIAWLETGTDSCWTQGVSWTYTRRSGDAMVDCLSCVQGLRSCTSCKFLIMCLTILRGYILNG